MNLKKKQTEKQGVFGLFLRYFFQQIMVRMYLKD